MKLSRVLSSRRRSVLWLVLPQIMTRLASFYVFAAVARRLDPGELGALSLAVAIAGVTVPLATAVVGKPLSIAADDDQRSEFGRSGAAAAVWIGVAVGVALVPAALLTHGLARVALFGGAIGLPTTIVMEATFWRSVFIDGRRSAALWYSGGYLAQVVLVTGCVAVFSGNALILAAVASLAPPAVVQMIRHRDLRPSAARVWFGRHRGLWVPYVVGTAASVGLVQAIPAVLSAAAGFRAAGVYRAAELAFGGTNLLIGVAVSALITQIAANPRRMYVLVTGGLIGVAVANGIVLRLLPESFLHVLFGSTAPLLVGILLVVTVQRMALAASTVGNVLLIPLVRARVGGALDVISAALSLVALIVGAVLDGLRGALIGLAAAEVVLAAGALWLLRRTLRAGRRVAPEPAPT